MKMAYSVEVVSHCVELKARVGLKTIDRFQSKKQKGRRQKPNAEILLLVDHKATSKKQESKCQLTKCDVMIGH